MRAIFLATYERVSSWATCSKSIPNLDFYWLPKKILIFFADLGIVTNPYWSKNSPATAAVVIIVPNHSWLGKNQISIKSQNLYQINKRWAFWSQISPAWKACLQSLIKPFKGCNKRWELFWLKVQCSQTIQFFWQIDWWASHCGGFHLQYGPNEVDFLHNSQDLSSAAQ